MSAPTLHGGDKLAQVTTDGGHPNITTQQPAFPDFHRKLADPSAFSWFALGAPFIIWGLTFLGARGIDMDRINVVTAPAMSFGFVLLTLSTIFEFLSGRTFPATLFGVFAGFFGGFAVLHVSWFGLTGSFDGQKPNTYATGGEAASELMTIQGLWLSTYVILTAFLLLAATRQTAIVCATLLFLELFLVLAMAYYFNEGLSAPLATATGAFGIAGGICSWYAGLSSLLTADSAHFTVPIFPLIKEE